MPLATVVTILQPAVAFVALSAGLGVLVFLVVRRTLISALVGSTVVCSLLLGFRTTLPWSVRYYVQDMIYEPLVRDIFQPMSETIMSAIFHLVFPYVLLVCIVRFSPLRHSKKSNQPLEPMAPRGRGSP